MKPLASSLLAAALAASALLTAPGAVAGLFEDDEARLAIRDLRQRVEALRGQSEALRVQSEAQRQLGEAQRQLVEAQRLLIDKQGEELRRAIDDGVLARRSVLELQTQIETLRGELARLRGQDEQIAREIAELQRRQKDVAQGVDERLRRFEPVKVTLEGREFMADPAEQRDYEVAVALFRKGEFQAAHTALADFGRRYPESGYGATALFWQANAQYGIRDYRGAIGNFRQLLARAPDDPRASEAALGIANCQIELKELPAARKTLADLIKAYPQTEAAGAARERLTRLR
jgi:tol-pal system protein YbgF